ncbi:MAG: hypothetical protein CMF49_05050 [Legionellales bacterium]|nr:hypothetical protein [Legionellales bacterium]|tara:strand:- start:2789 stop:3253 length:465 start_codon:yes stop_codon:yes gene_type:complete
MQTIHYKPLSKELIWLSELTIGNSNKKRLEVAIVKLHQVFFKAKKGDAKAQALVQEWAQKIKETHDYFEVIHKQYDEKIKREIGAVTYEPYDKILSWSVNCELVGKFIIFLMLYDLTSAKINSSKMFYENNQKVKNIQRGASKLLTMFLVYTSN